MADDGQFEVADDFLTVGRTFAEYCRMFDLAPADLAGRRVLDCAAGPGAFVAVAAEFADQAVGLDPMYGPSAAALEDVCADAVERNRAQLREMSDRFVWDHYGDPDTRVRFQRAAYERFLADYAATPGRYVAGALPDLPLSDGVADLALVGNLLFLYDDRLDRAFHEAALRDLARVASEVRVFPLHALDRERSTLVDPVVASLRDAGHTCSVRPVPYEFQPGATEMLVVGG
jgi:SAM-dependent methyltransferase